MSDERFREWCREVIGEKGTLGGIEALMKAPNHPHYAKMWQALTERGYGRPEQKIAHGGKVEVVIRREGQPPDPKPK